jgi:hypothetical protein
MPNPVHRDCHPHPSINEPEPLGPLTRNTV